MNILIIEENEGLGKVLEKVFIDKNFKTTWVRDGVAGLNHMRVDLPHVVIMDMELPSLSGYEILELRLKEPALVNIPMLVITNSGEPVELARLKSLSVADHVVKVSMTPEEVYEKTATILGIGSEVNTSGELVVDTGAKTPQNKTNLEGINILWVEDDMFLASIVGRKLASTGAKYIQAKSADEAFANLSKDKPQVIVLDLMLPGMNGFEILEKLKSEETTKAIPVIVLSNLDQRDDMEKCFQLGASKFFVKALVTLDRIFDEIRAIVSTK